jgi:hypothetical protein
VIALPVLAAVAELCAAPASAPVAGTPAEAAAYVAVAESERAAGQLATAVVALRRALAIEPQNPRARAALAELCAGDRGGPASPLQRGIDAYLDGDDDRARRELGLALAGGDPDVAGARFFLGMLALRAHDHGAALDELERAAADPRYAGPAAEMRRLAARDGLIALLAAFEVEADTNVELLPETPPSMSTLGPPVADVSSLVLAAVAAHPLPWLTLDDAFSWRAQARLTQFDLVENRAGARVEWRRGRHDFQLGAGLDYDAVGGETYLIAGGGRLGYGGALTRSLALDASYALRWRDFATQDSFSGWQQQARIGVAWHSPRVEVSAALLGVRDGAADPIYADLGGGLEVGARWRPLFGVRLAARVTFLGLRFDAAEPDGPLREDARLSGGLDAEVDLGDHFLALAGVELTSNSSTVEDFRYTQAVAHVGLAASFGLP